MSLRLRLGATALAAAMTAGGVAGFVARASGHPRLEPSTAAACADCHMSDYRGARHHVGEKPTTCGVCHAQSGWHPTHLDHDFALTGAHATAKCFACHTGSPARFHGTPRECYGCHRADYEKAPRHVDRFPTTCEECHTTDAWKPAHDHRPPEPPPPPATATATATAPKVKPKPKPPPTAPPRPTAQPSTNPFNPDVLTHPSRRR